MHSSFYAFALVILCLCTFATTKTFAFSSLNNNNNMKVAITGATGRLGRTTIHQLMDREIPVKCLLRQAAPPDELLEIQKKYPKLIEFVTNGDVTSFPKLVELVEGCTHCLALHGATARSTWKEILTAAEGSEDSDPSHAKQVNCQSMKFLVQACYQTPSMKQIVRITGKGEEPWSFFSVLINGLGRMAKGWNYEGEQVLRENKDKVAYTIIRPGIMKEDYDPDAEQVHLELADNGGDLKVSAVAYSQIAELCIESCFQPQAKCTTLTAMNVAIEESGDKKSLVDRLKQVKQDSRQFPQNLIEEHKRAVKTVFTSLAGGFLAIVAGILFKFFR